MPRCSPLASRFSGVLQTAVALLAIACRDTSAPEEIPAKLAFLTTVQPATSIARLPIVPAIKIAVQDAAGNTINTAIIPVTLTLGNNLAGAKISGTTTVRAVDGVATFSDVSIDNAGSGYTLIASSPNLTSVTSMSFAVVIGPAAKLVFTTQPASTIARTALPTFSVTVQDVAGNAVNSPISVTLRMGFNAGTGTLLGSITRQAVDGVATFSDVSITEPGNGYTLVAFGTNNNALVNATSLPFNQTVGAATRVGFTTGPTLARAGEVIGPVVAAVQDAAGNVIRTANNLITIAIGANAGGGTLSGTTSSPAVNGIATFSDLKIDKTGINYTLVATTTNLASGTSNAFAIRNELAFSSVSAGYFHTCGVTTAGAVFCWGSNASGQLGTGNTTDSRTAEPVSGGQVYSTVTAGRDHNCAVTPAGVAQCWGSNDNFQLGTANGANSSVPAAVAGAISFATAIGGYSHSCGVTKAGVGYCWGDNSLGSLGTGTGVEALTPAAVAGGLSFSSISVGRYITCGVTTSRAGYCWGDNASGFLGDGTTTRRIIPVAVTGQLEFAMIGAGGFNSCGLTVTGQAYCWGANGIGQLGDGTLNTRVTPTAVAGGHSFVSLSVGNRHACALKSDGAAYCWGDNSTGALGTVNTISSSVPVAVSGGLKFASISAGRFHTCAITNAGAAYCWGENLSGELGDGTTVPKLVPTAVR